MNKYLTAGIIALSFLVSSCQFVGGQHVGGDGHITTEERKVQSFNSVEAGGAIKVRVRQDPNTSVKIEADQNLLPYIDVYNQGDKIVIRQKQGYNLDPSREIVAYIAAPVFKDIDISGASEVTGENTISSNEELNLHSSGASEFNLQVNVPKIRAELSGSGNISLKGQATDFEASVSGASGLKCLDLTTDNTRLDLSGASNAEITTNKKLDVQASGASHVNYRGNASVSSDVSGASSVKKI